ncbi:MAG: hypothetical protein ACRD6W_11150, partial [Nitrososphaerales archaeon]
TTVAVAEPLIVWLPTWPEKGARSTLALAHRRTLPSDLLASNAGLPGPGGPGEPFTKIPPPPPLD